MLYLYKPGSGIKGGLMSIWLMGCYDKSSYQWKTVTKVHTGHDDETLDRLQRELAPNMIKIKGKKKSETSHRCWNIYISMYRTLNFTF